MLFALHAACECCLLCAAMGYAPCWVTINPVFAESVPCYRLCIVWYKRSPLYAMRYLLQIFPVVGYALFPNSVPLYRLYVYIICYKCSPS